jgi:uncharacterized membrane protein (UPF0127 family)
VKEIILKKCIIAKSFWTRFMGLMGKKALPMEEGILFPKCNSIHTFFMRFPIDVILLSKECIVEKTVQELKPWRLLLPQKNVRHVLEVSSGFIEQQKVLRGDFFKMERANS